MLDGKPMTGVTTVLSVIAKPALIPWAVKMATDYIKTNCKQDDLMRYLVNLADLEAAKSAHRKKKEEAGEKGQDVHKLAEDIIKQAIKDDGYLPPSLVSEDTQIQHFIDWAKNNSIKFVESEKQMYCDKDGLFVAGTVDLVFEKDCKTYIGDIKTYAKLWDRTPMLQCAAYGLMYQNMSGKQIDGYCVLLLTKTGEFKEQWSYYVEGDTKGFLAGYQLFNTLENWN